MPSDGSSQHQVFLDTKVFGSLDGLRAIAILAVIWHHAGAESWQLRLADRGFLGVDLFFVISGFLIVTLMLREKEATSNISLKGFYWRRALRILPPYLLFLGILLATALLKPGSGSDQVLRDLPWAFLYLTNIVPAQGLLSITWSLSVEEQFYLVMPALQKLAARALTWTLPILWLVAVLPSFGLFPSLNLPHFFRNTTFGPILLGVILAQVLHSPRGYRLTARILGWKGAPLIALGLVAMAASHPARDIAGWPRITIHFAFAALVGSCVLREKHVLQPLLQSWPFRRIGAVSYGIYLYHLLVLHFVTAFLQRTPWRGQTVTFLLMAVGTWCAAEVSYRFYEARFLALKRRYR